ncbi:MAG: phosphonate C-P lyase system protein PhnG [Pseudomonadota bacterium]
MAATLAPEVAPDTKARRANMGVLARAPEGRAAALLARAGLAQAFDWLRRPEIGTVMVRGRAGGTGAPFNLGEMTVTRAALKLGCGAVGHGHVAGRSKPGAEAAALIDALMQTGVAAEVEAAVLAPLRAEEAARKSARAQKAAATKVEFFTLVRGED